MEENKLPEEPKVEAVAEEVVAVEEKPVVNEAPKSDVVFNDKPKKNIGMILGMILLLILAAGGIGFGVWAMMNGNQQKEVLNSRINELEQKNKELSDKMAIDIDDVDDNDDIGSSNDEWSSFSSNLLSQSMYVMGYYWHYNGSDNEHYVAYAMKDDNGHLTITDAGNNMNYGNNPVILELDNVLMVYYIKVGNGGVPYFYIVDKNGGVNRVDISENSSRQLEKVGDYTRIATILEAGGSEAILVDIKGNIYNSF